MSVHNTLRFDHDKTRLELDVRLERQDGHEGQLDTNLETIDGSHTRLSIVMGRWTRRGPRSPWREDSFGQDIAGVRAFARHCPAEQRAAIERLCEIWSEWHLNDMQAGTTAQTEAIGLAKAAGEIQDGMFYDTACVALAARGLLDDRGYRYGSKWLVKRLPQAIQSEVLSLCEQLATK